MVRRIGRAVREEVHLSPAIGLAVGKFPAQVAAASLEPNRVLLVSPGREATFLAPLPVDLLPLDEELARQLRMLGIRTLGQLAALPVSAVMARFGAGARRLHQLARGCDDTPLRPRCPVKTERVSRQFVGPVTDQAILEAAIHAIAAELAYRLQTGGLAGRELWLVLELEDGGIRTGRWVLRRPTNDSGRLARILTELVGQARVDLGITGIQVTLAGLVPAVGEQLDLFRPQTGQQHRLRRVLADLVARYGADCFYHISLTDRAASLPERRFRLREVESS